MLKEEDGWSTIEITKILGIKRQRLRGWIDDTPGFFNPSIRPAKGPGQKAIYSEEDVYLFALFQHLIDVLHINRKTAVSIANIVRKSSAEKKEFSKEWYESVNYLAVFFNINNDLLEYLIGLPEIKQGKLLEISCESEVKYSSQCVEILNNNDSTWDDVIIVNFKKIRERIFEAMGNIWYDHD